MSKIQVQSSGRIRELLQNSHANAKIPMNESKYVYLLALTLTQDYTVLIPTKLGRVKTALLYIDNLSQTENSPRVRAISEK
jgi:hypothetical protein